MTHYLGNLRKSLGSQMVPKFLRKSCRIRIDCARHKDPIGFFVLCRQAFGDFPHRGSSRGNVLL